MFEIHWVTCPDPAPKPVTWLAVRCGWPDAQQWLQTEELLLKLLTTSTQCYWIANRLFAETLVISMHSVVTFHLLSSRVNQTQSGRWTPSVLWHWFSVSLQLFSLQWTRWATTGQAEVLHRFQRIQNFPVNRIFFHCVWKQKKLLLVSSFQLSCRVENLHGCRHSEVASLRQKAAGAAVCQAKINQTLFMKHFSWMRARCC